MASRTDAPGSASGSTSSGSPSSTASNEGRRSPLTPSDVRGAAQLATEATLQTTRLVETVHARVHAALVRTPLREATRTGGLTGWIYRAIRLITRLAGRATVGASQVAEHVTRHAPPPETKTRQRLLSIVNGVLGDHLSDSGNPLARSFSLRDANGQLLDGPPSDARASMGDTVIVFVHGLCLSDRAWWASPDTRGHVEAIAAATGGVPVFARYNTGRHIGGNGQLFSRHVEALARRERPSRIILVAHSMGGLVVRSAFRHARQTAARWPSRVTETVYLGTPHQGAPLERAGAWIEEQLRRTAFTAPFTALTSLRSRGIQDLRYGTLAAGDAPSSPVSRASGPHPAAGRALYVAATLSPEPSAVQKIGDGLVPLPSALHTTDAPPGTRRVFENLGHLELLHAPAVTAYLCDWLSAPAPSSGDCDPPLLTETAPPPESPV